jgi:hypothetical protein
MNFFAGGRLYFEYGFRRSDTDNMNVQTKNIFFDFIDILEPSYIIPWGNIILYTFLSLLGLFLISASAFIILYCRYKNNRNKISNN